MLSLVAELLRFSQLPVRLLNGRVVDGIPHASALRFASLAMLLLLRAIHELPFQNHKVLVVLNRLHVAWLRRIERVLAWGVICLDRNVDVITRLLLQK